MNFPNLINSKLPNVGTTIFTVMSKLAAENNAINLSQGFPDFSCNPDLVELVGKYMKAGNNQYAPMAGLIQLREMLAQKTEELYGAQYNPDTEITITAGATQAIYTAITAIIREGDEVIVFEPAYDCYQPAIELNGGKTIYLQLKAPSYSIDWEEVKKMMNHRTKMIIVNTPHNPTGSIMSAADMVMLQKLTKDTDIVIISDEVYEHIVFDGHVHQSVARYPHLATPIQFALAEFLQQKNQYVELGNFYQKKRDYFISLIKNSRFELTPSAGTYFQLLNYKKLSSEKDTDYAIRLTKEFKLAAIPISVFYHEGVDNHVLRFCFAKKEETLEKAAAIINTI
ncbi:MAG: aminotransferase class I/II-fold pyridoxal phosphate-dependent enzyme [Bacteroidetes bacterium]|nr:aminotransferase class I/II-fold pyridoxal phosphate-dependent enzyme [Bacteroidota bacterium]